MNTNAQTAATAKNWFLRHKILSVVIIVAIGLIAWRVVHAINAKNAPTSYVLGTVERGTIVAAVSGTGQVSASNQVDLSPKASGKLIYINAKVGQYVQQGALIAQVDPGSAAYDLETAKISYEKTVTVDPDDLQNAKNDVASAAASARSQLAASVTSITDTLSDINDLNGGYVANADRADSSSTSSTYHSRAANSYYDAYKKLRDFSKAYAALTAASSNDTVLQLLDSAHAVSVSIVQAAQDTKNAVTYFRDEDTSSSDSAASTAAYTSATSDVSAANTAVTQLLSVKNSLVSAQQALDNIQNGPDELDVRSAQASLSAKQEAYADTQVRAPFAGVIAAVPASIGDTASASTPVATLITKQKVAELSLNEIDAAKVSAGDKATLTFDAVDGLTITGSVLTVDLVGTVSQGVVNYSVKIGFDTDDDRVKPGMTVSANIITDTATDVLMVPASAITTRNGVSTVLVVDDAAAAAATSAAQGTSQGVELATAPQAVEVTTGLTNDESTEIVSGLAEGQHIVVRTVAKSSTTAAATTSAPSIFGGATRTGGNANFRSTGAVRIGG